MVQLLHLGPLGNATGAGHMDTVHGRVNLTEMLETQYWKSFVENKVIFLSLGPTKAIKHKSNK